MTEGSRDGTSGRSEIPPTQRHSEESIGIIEAYLPPLRKPLSAYSFFLSLFSPSLIPSLLRDSFPRGYRVAVRANVAGGESILSRNNRISIRSLRRTSNLITLPLEFHFFFPDPSLPSNGGGKDAVVRSRGREGSEREREADTASLRLFASAPLLFSGPITGSNLMLRVAAGRISVDVAIGDSRGARRARRGLRVPRGSRAGSDGA